MTNRKTVARALSSISSHVPGLGGMISEGATEPHLGEGRAIASPARAEPAQTASAIILHDAGGREAEADHRIALHEASHATTGRLLGQPIGGATIVEGDDFSGKVWGPTYQSRFTPSPSVPCLCEQIGSLMPAPGENRKCISEIVLHCHNRVVELCAGSCGEQLFLGSAWDAVDDRKQERALASLVASSPEAIEAFIAFARAEATHLLRAHEHVVRALTAELLSRRTLDGGEIDQTIAEAVTLQAQDAERARRADWREREASARNFIAMVEP